MAEKYRVVGFGLPDSSGSPRNPDDVTLVFVWSDGSESEEKTIKLPVGSLKEFEEEVERHWAEMEAGRARETVVSDAVMKLAVGRTDKGRMA